MHKARYPVRYSIELGDFDPPSSVEHVAPGLSNSHSNHGYADDVLLASIIRDDEGKIASVAFASSKGGLQPTREILEAVQFMIAHYLEHHLTD